MILTESEIDEVVRRIVERLAPEKVILYGSYATGRATIRSDLDLFVVKETSLPVERRADPLAGLFTHRLIPVDVHIFTPEEVREYGKDPYSFVSAVLESGKTFYEK